MPEEAVPRILFYVGLLFSICLVSTFTFWAAAQIARTEYRSLMSALACTMRLFFYSISLLCILVAATTFNFGPSDPRDPTMGWIQIGGTIWIVFPCVWRAFRQKGPRMVVCGVLAIVLSGALIGLAAWASPGLRQLLSDMPHALARTS
jgi:hypothetical protein